MSGQLKNDTEERKLRVTLLSVGWKASCNGDLTTINRELAIQMAKHPNVEVSVFLPWCTEEDKKDADGYNVKLIEAVKLPGLKPVLWLASVPDGHAMDCVLGHGVDLGQQIPLIKRNPNYSNCRWIQVVHTVPEEIGMYKSISEGQQMQQTEIELCKMADQVVTIGPKLTDAYKHQIRKPDIFNLTPSILSEFSDVQQASDEERKFCVLVTESGNSEDFYVKGYDVAAKAIAELKDKSYQLKFASKQRGKEDELANKLLQCGIDRNQLMICSFDENRETLANLFSAVDIAILPSKTEGFGFSALEAISAGLPVLVSGNSGIAEALRKVPIGSQCVVDSEDPAEWARAIKAVRYKERNVRLAEARILRENYLQQFSWEKPCNSLVEKMYSLAFGSEIKITVGVDDLKPEEQNMQTGMLTTESVRQQEVQQPRASATSAAPGSVSHPQTEDLLALKEKNFQSILEGCYHSTKPQSIEEWNWFREYAKEMRLIITGVSVGSLVITVKCESLMILEELWKDYSSGHLREVVQNCFVTERILKELNLAELRLKTTMDIEEYNACKMFFEKDALRGSTSRSPLTKEQGEKSEWKTKVMEMAKLEGMLPLPGSSTFDPEEELVEPRLKRQRMEGSFPVLKFSTINLEGTLAHVRVELQRLEGTFFPPALLNADLEEKLKKLLTELERQRDKGSLPPTFSTIEVELDERLKKFQKWRIEGCSVPSNSRYILLQAVLSSEFRSTSSTSESPQKKEQWRKSEQKTKIMETAELEGTSPLIVVPTTGHGKELEELWRRKGALSSEFHSTSSTSESPQKKEQWEKSEQKTKIMETAKLEGTSPLIVVPTTGHGKKLEEPWGRKGMWPLPGSSTFDLQEKLEELLMKLQIMKGSSSLPVTDLKEKLEQVFEEIRMLRMKGGFSVLKFSTIDLKKKLAELRMELQRLRMEGTFPPPELFTADLEDELEQLEQLLIEQREKMKGSSHFLVETVIRLRKELEKVKMEALENAMYLTIRSGLAKFDVSLPEELQNYVSYLLDESAKLHLRKQVLQPPRALEELREAMDKGELKTFLTIHIREGAWQVVLLFTDELPKYKLPWDWCGIILFKDEDEEVSNEVIYSSTSGILNGWPTHYDPSLVTLCKAITNKDWKVTRLILSRSRIPDEGLKNLSTALTQSELYSLTLYDIGLQSQGLEHLCNALTSVNCRLTNLNVSSNQLGDNGLKHLCDALTSSNCALTKLIVGFNRLGDGGIKELSEVLTKGFCTLTSLDIRGNEFGDEGIKHLCRALTDTKCKLRSLNLRANSYVTDDGKKYLSQMLTGTDWEDEGALRLSRSTTKETKEQVSDTEP